MTDKSGNRKSGLNVIKNKTNREHSSAGNRLNSQERRILREKQVRNTYIAIGAGVALAIVVICILFFRKAPITEEKGLTKDVLRYQQQVEKYCKEYNISGFSQIVMAMMQQESAGQGTDVMQCSESPFNKNYSNSPGSITDVDYSINVGVQTFAYCLEQAGCTSVKDMDGLKLALQEYNFGNDYVAWAKENYNGYTPENALEFSEKKKQELGWDVYGDPLYVEHVLQYYEG